jgi:putative ABC transport system permease protein
MSVLKFAAKNSMRHPLRTGLTIFGLAIAIVSFTVIQTSIDAWYAGAAASSPNRLVTRHAVSLVFSMPVAYADRIAKVDGVKQVAVSGWFGGIYVDKSNFFANFAVSHENFFDLYPEFIIPPDQLQTFKSERNAVIVGRKLADRFGWSVGDRVQLAGSIYPGTWDFVIRGIYTGAKANTDENQWMHRWDFVDEQLRQTMAGRAGQAGTFIIQIHDPSRSAEICKAIDDLFANSSAETKTETEEAFQLSFVEMGKAIIVGLEIVSYMVIGIILLVLANTMAMTTRERVSEYAVLKTLGFQSFHVAGLIFSESLFLAISGGLLGIALAFPVCSLVAIPMSTFFPIFEVSTMTLIWGLIFALIVGFIAGLFPASKAIRTPIVDGLRIID